MSRPGRILTVACLFGVSLLAACGGGGGGGSTPPVVSPSSNPGGSPPPTQSPTPAPTATPTPTPAPTATPTPSPAPSSTPFAFSWVNAGMGRVNGLDGQFAPGNNGDKDTDDGDMMPGVAGALAQGGGQGPTGTTLDGISCDPTMSNTYHVHAFVGLFVNGTEIAIPDAIGIVGATGDRTDSNGWPNQEIYGTCFYHVHTHDASGMIHLEDADPSGAPVTASLFTLGNLLDIWGLNVNATQFGTFSGPVTVYTSGQFARTGCSNAPGSCDVGSNSYTLWTGDPHTIPLYMHEAVWFEVGTGNPDPLHLPGVHFATQQ